VPIDRDVVLKQAETLLRQGELDGAIAEYLRLVDSEDVDDVYRGVEAVADIALLAGDYDRAIEALQTFLIRVTHIPALVKLVAVCAEAGRRDALDEAQAILAGAALDAGRAIGRDSIESDGADAPDLDAVFASMRSRAAEDPKMAGAATIYERGLNHVLHDRIDDAMADLAAAARAPLYRFTAAAQLGRLHIERGELKAAVEWLERAAEAPAPTPDEGVALLYDLADTLDRRGESARALAVLMELDADAAGYRDVQQRINELSRQQERSPGA